MPIYWKSVTAMHTSNEHRQFERTACSFQVVMRHPSIGILHGSARDVSEGGVFVQLQNVILPPVGTVMSVTIKRHTGTINNEPVSMRVVHHNGGGLGLSFAVS
jgi:hypothetical protein